jgi:hypothetical protein
VRNTSFSSTILKLYSEIALNLPSWDFLYNSDALLTLRQADNTCLAHLPGTRLLPPRGNYTEITSHITLTTLHVATDTDWAVLYSLGHAQAAFPCLFLARGTAMDRPRAGDRGRGNAVCSVPKRCTLRKLQ